MDIANLVKQKIPCKINIIKKNNDPRSYRQDSGKLLRTGFKPSSSVKKAISDIKNKYENNKIIFDEKCNTVKWMKRLVLAVGREINLLANYPKSKRDTVSRANEKTDADRKIARRFDKEFFDGDRKHGYGGFKYNEKFWTPVIPTFIEYWNLTKDSQFWMLDVPKGLCYMI